MSALELPVVADATIRSTLPSQNFGNLPQLTVEPGSNAYLRFDLATALPTGVTPSMLGQATLILYVNKLVAAGDVSFSPVCAAWNEGTLTYTNAPASCPGAPDSFTVTAVNQVVAVNVTQLVQNWIGGGSVNNGIALIGAGQTAVYFDSKESTATSRPARLVIEITGALGRKGDQGNAGLPGAAGPTGDQGLQGPGGPSGIVGPQGMVGLTGATGANGANGATGSVGLKGNQGSKGGPGDSGPLGATGNHGAIGPVGIQGNQGAQGPIGDGGPIGHAGVDGPAGTPAAGSFSWYFYDSSVNGRSVFGPPGFSEFGAQCNSNQRMIRGGCGYRDAGVAATNLTVNYSGPNVSDHLDSSGQPTQWLCRLSNNLTITALPVRICVLCLQQ
jgi:hypothetical protein